MAEKSKFYIFKAEDNKRAFYMLISNHVISSAILILKNSNINYLAMLDSTGYYRGKTKLLAMKVVKDCKGLIVCFSHPKEELIFKANSKKSIMKASNLFRFWKEIFSSRCQSCKDKNCYMKTWSNFEPQDGYPYKDIREIPYFKDDPKSRLLDNLDKSPMKINDFFNGLLIRSDFVKGGLIFSYCCMSPVVESETSSISIVRMVKFLRTSDFSSFESAEKSTTKFFKKFNINKNMLESFDYQKYESINNIIEDEVKVIKPRSLL